MARCANELRHSKTRSIEAMGFSEGSVLGYLVEEFFYVSDRVQAAGAHGSKENQTLPCYRDRRRLSNAIWRRNPSELRVARSDGCVDNSKQPSGCGSESIGFSTMCAKRGWRSSGSFTRQRRGPFIRRNHEDPKYL